MLSLIPWKLVVLTLFVWLGTILRKRKKARLEEQNLDLRPAQRMLHGIENGTGFVVNEVELMTLKVSSDLLRRLIELQIRLADKMDYLAAELEKIGLGSRD